jgi:preprotein translocase subunit Sec63
MIILLSTLFILLLIVLIKFKLIAALFYLMPLLIKIKEKFNLKTYQNKSSSDISNLHEAYEILGIDKSASIEEIETAYKDLIRKNHPDNGGSEYLAKKINLAREFILKEKKIRGK